MTGEQLADRTRRAAAVAVAAAQELGLRVQHAAVLHDVLSVMVHLAPEPVVARNSGSADGGDGTK